LLAATGGCVLALHNLWLNLPKSGWPFWSSVIHVPLDTFVAFYGIFRLRFIQLAIGWVSLAVFMASAFLVFTELGSAHPRPIPFFWMTNGLTSSVTAYLLLIDREVRAFRAQLRPLP
jgi:hypothetical protein